MCKEMVVVNRVDLGNRITGYELFNCDGKDIIGKTEKQIKDCLKSGTVVKGFKLGASDELLIDNEFVTNLMIKTGIGTLTPSNEDSIVNLMYTVVGRSGNEFEVITSRFWHGTMSEEKIKMLHEMGAVNGIKLDNKSKVQLVEIKSVNEVKESDKASEVKEVTA